MEKPFDGRNLHLQGKEGFWFLEILKVVEISCHRLLLMVPQY